MLRKLSLLFTKAQKTKLLKISFLLIVGVFFEMLGIGLLLPLLAIMLSDNLALDYPSLNNLLIFFNHPDKQTIIITGFLILILFYFVKLFFIMYLNWVQANFTAGINENFSNRLFSGFLNMPYINHLERNSSNLLHIIIGEVTMFATVTQAIMLLLTEFSIIIGVAIMLIYIEPFGSLIVILFISLSSFIFYRITRIRLMKWGKERQECEKNINKNILQSLHGIKDVKILNKENYFIKIFQNFNNRKTNITTKYTALQQFPRVFLELIAVIGLTILVYIMILQGKQLNVIVPILGVFISAAFRMLPSLNRIMSSTQNIKYAQPVINVIYDELEKLNNISNITNNKNFLFNKEIILSNVEFNYNNNKKKILNNISFNIIKGQSIGIIGQSGAGKSTIVDIILGLLKITNGSVLVDGIDISTSISSWQKNIGYVPQNIYLIDDTIKKNIAFGIEDEDINIERINHVILLAQLNEFIDSLEFGINSNVGDRGSKLSGGQKQRIGIARALYRNPQILILDEATSALDNETEQDFMKAINNLKGSITTIIIAHRLSTVANTDYIYVLENGRLIKSGTPAQIL